MNSEIVPESFSIDINNAYVSEVEVSHKPETFYTANCAMQLIKNKRSVKATFHAESLDLSGLTSLTEHLGDTKGRAFKVIIETIY